MGPAVQVSAWRPCRSAPGACTRRRFNECESSCLAFNIMQAGHGRIRSAINTKPSTQAAQAAQALIRRRRCRRRRAGRPARAGPAPRAGSPPHQTPPACRRCCRAARRGCSPPRPGLRAPRGPGFRARRRRCRRPAARAPGAAQQGGGVGGSASLRPTLLLSTPCALPLCAPPALPASRRLEQICLLPTRRPNGQARPGAKLPAGDCIPHMAGHTTADLQRALQARRLLLQVSGKGGVVVVAQRRRGAAHQRLERGALLPGVAGVGSEGQHTGGAWLQSRRPVSAWAASKWKIRRLRWHALPAICCSSAPPARACCRAPRRRRRRRGTSSPPSSPAPSSQSAPRVARSEYGPCGCGEPLAPRRALRSGQRGAARVG